MAHGRALIAVILFAVGAIGLPAAPGSAAEPLPGLFGQWLDPQAMLDRLFGEQSEDDEKALARIEVSPKDERRIGEAAIQAYLAKLKRQGVRVVTRGRDVEYLRSLAESIRPLMANADRYRRVTIYLADSPRCDARSFPGGHLVFFRGLLEAAQSEAALIGMLGHELAHLDRGHVLARARRVKLAEQAFSGKNPGMSPEQFFAAGTAAARLWTRPFRPEYELAADRDGARWAYLAGYDPRELAELFLRAGQRDPGARLPLPGFLQSHPPPESRHRAILELYDEMQKERPNRGLWIGKQNLRSRTPWKGR